MLIFLAAISTKLSMTNTAAGLPTPLYGPVGGLLDVIHFTFEQKFLILYGPCKKPATCIGSRAAVQG